MSESVRLNLARKYRPKSLKNVVGQTVAVKILSEALKTDRIAPAYLFSGPRGTGKTSCARIFAKAATCLSKDLAHRPCEKCESCLAQNAGQFMDLLEIDGASHTGVDDVRSIIESVAYRPALGARSVYLIDEVHMLSNAAFNALLKTLEEPPKHALFLFATTEPEQVPATILSRIQRIEMRRLSEKEILSNLSFIAKEEKIEAPDSSLEQIAAASDGSLRDAQTLFEQLILLSGSKKLDPSIVDSFLGTIGVEQEIFLLEHIAEKKLPLVLAKVREFFEQGKDLVRLLERLLIWTRALLLVKSSGETSLIEKEIDVASVQRLMKAFDLWSVDDVDRLLEIFWAGHERIHKSELPRICLESTLIRASRIPLTADLGRLIAQFGESLSAEAPPPPSFQAPATFSRPTEPTRNTEAPARTSERSDAPPASLQPPNQEKITTVEQILLSLRKRRPNLHAIVSCAEKVDWTGDELRIQFPKSHFAYRQLSEKIVLRECEELVSELTSGRCRKIIASEGASSPAASPTSKRTGDFMSEAKKKMMSDPLVQKAAQFLNAEVESVTIEGIRSETKPRSKEK